MDRTDFARAIKIATRQLRATVLSLKFRKLDALSYDISRNIKDDKEFCFWVVRYLFTGTATYSSNSGTTVDYPGMPSTNGPGRDGLEGFSRIAPLAAAWIAGTGDHHVECLDGKSFDLLEFLRTGIVNGTDPDHKNYWGPIRAEDQILAESADIALSIWMIWDRINDSLTGRHRSNLLKWLEGATQWEVRYNNWVLFPLIVQSVIFRLTGNMDKTRFDYLWDQIKSMRRNGGWYSDGDGNKFDYYNAWSFHYSFFWLHIIGGDFLIRDFAIKDMHLFLKSYKFLASEYGFPMMGRSTCYRVACAAPLVCGSIMNDTEVSLGFAKCALTKSLRYFVENGCLRKGIITQGYFKSDEKIFENYSGPASALWSMRAVIPAVYFGDKVGFWDASPEQFPVQKADFDIFIETPKWRVTGDKTSGNVRISTDHTNPDAQLIERSFLEKLKDTLRGYPNRHENESFKYDKGYYDSKFFYR